MNEEKPFEGENPFRKLDKKRFLSHDEKKKAKSLKKNGLISNNDGEVSSFYAEFVSPQDEGETRAFLNAVSGVTELGAPANAKRENGLPLPPWITLFSANRLSGRPIVRCQKRKKTILLLK